MSNANASIQSQSSSIGGLKCFKIQPLPVEDSDEENYDGLLQTICRMIGEDKKVALLCDTNALEKFSCYFRPLKNDLSIYTHVNNSVRRILHVPANRVPEGKSWPRMHDNNYPNVYCSVVALLEAAKNDGNDVFIPCFSGNLQMASNLHVMEKDFKTLFSHFTPHVLFTDQFCETFERFLPTNDSGPYALTPNGGPNSLQTLFMNTHGSSKALRVCGCSSGMTSKRVMETLFGPLRDKTIQTYNLVWHTTKSHILVAKVLSGKCTLRVGGKDFQKLEMTLTKGSSPVEVLVWETGGQEIGRKKEEDCYNNPYFKHVSFPEEDAKEYEKEYELVANIPNVPTFSTQDAEEYERLFETMISQRGTLEWSTWGPIVESLWTKKSKIHFLTMKVITTKTEELMEEALKNMEDVIPFHKRNTYHITDLTPTPLKRSRGYDGSAFLHRATSQVV